MDIYYFSPDHSLCPVEDAVREQQQQKSCRVCPCPCHLVRRRLRVPVVAQGGKKPMSTHEHAGSIPGLAPWVKDLVLL